MVLAMNEVKLHDLVFEPFISAKEIRQAVEALAKQIDQDYAGKNPVLLIVLNGAFVFAADLVRLISVPIRLDFVKVSSYAGTSSSGQLQGYFFWQTFPSLLYSWNFLLKNKPHLAD